MTAPGTGHPDLSLSFGDPHPSLAGGAVHHVIIQCSDNLFRIEAHDDLLSNFKGWNPLQAHGPELAVGSRVFVDIPHFVDESGLIEKLLSLGTVGSGFAAVHDDFFHGDPPFSVLSTKHMIVML